MQGGHPLLIEWGGFLGKGGAGLPPSDPSPTAQWSATPPNFGEEKGRVGRGRSRAWRAGDLPEPGARAGALMIPGEPVKAGDWESVLKVGREAVER